MLIKNFRVPVGKMCIEVPAGLVDENESVESAAVRELKEETGYDGKITKIMPVSQIDQWKSRENTQLVFMEIDGDLEVNKNPKPNLEETEYIEVFLVSLDDPFPIIDSIFYILYLIFIIRINERRRLFDWYSFTSIFSRFEYEITVIMIFAVFLYLDN